MPKILAITSQILQQYRKVSGFSQKPFLNTESQQEYIRQLSDWGIQVMEHDKTAVQTAHEFMLQKTFSCTVDKDTYFVTRTAVGPIKTKYGAFRLLNFTVNDEWREYNVLVKADTYSENHLPQYTKKKKAFVRFDSGCEPGQLFSDVSCDCKAQLEQSMKYLGQSYQGAIIHIPRQDGRGHGTAFHLGTIYLQDELKLNTVQSASLLGSYISQEHQIDVRTYAGAVAILKILGLEQIVLDFGTNNPLKIKALQENGFTLFRREIKIKPTQYTREHLNAKRKELGHLL